MYDSKQITSLLLYLCESLGSFAVGYTQKLTISN
ncbi:hypothetical protein Xbud_00829 [Xenorhabdus budapestensis]|uniref:Uncharacterized protein n=1 Tax=Xenorhabdus budapestensis TaxID=290110 RepID=A0A2D0J4F8_XENBU|nr:hypothetical protein Xbud_00829 [Xenorhabdus budapestensis]